MNRKVIPVILIIAAACVALAACMRNGAVEARPTPSPTADYAPQVTAVPDAAQNGGATGPANGNANGNTAATSDGTLTPFDWANGAAGVEKAIARISEVSDARVVVVDSTALVGVRFDSVYKGQITDRIRQMVAAEVLRADPNIQTVAVTAADEDVKKVYALSDEIRAGRTVGELAAQINAIVRNATTLR